MKLTRRNRKEILFIALAAIALGVCNLIFKRFIDGSLCIIGGLGAFIIWIIRQR